MSESDVVPPGEGDDRAVPYWWARSRPRIGVSSCLLGEPVRFNGGHKQDRFLTEVLGRYVEWVPVCPEVEVGMGTPRDTVRLAGPDEDPRMVAPATGRDYTAEMTAFSRGRVRELADLSLSGYILKSKSPSCGLFRIPVHDGDRVRHREGRGLFAAALVAAEPLLAVEDERGLDDPRRRERFVERVFAHARLRELFVPGWRGADLEDFHTHHEPKLAARDPELAARAGRVVAGAAGRSPGEIERDYTARFLGALAAPAGPDGRAEPPHDAADADPP